MATPYNPLKMFAPKGRDVQSTRMDADPSGPGRGAAGDGKEPADQAGYMELEGATKDNDCTKVQVDGGVSSELGCCNEFSPQPGAQEFECGTCTFLANPHSEKNEGEEAAPLAGGNSQPVVSGQPS